MTYVAIVVEGGLFPPDLLEDLANGKGAGQDAAAFQIDPARLPDEMQAAFSDIRSYWDAFRRRLPNSKESRTSLTRAVWMLPVLERLGFEREGVKRRLLRHEGQHVDATLFSLLAPDL